MKWYKNMTEQQKKNFNKVLAVSIISTIIILLGIAGTCIWKHFTDYNTTLNINWEISIPSASHYSEIYSKDSGSSFNGDGIRYHIFSYEENAPINEMLVWQSEEGQTIFYGCYSDTVDVLLDTIDVPSEYYPDYSNCLYWYESQEDNSEIIILWNRNENTLYIVESFL